MKPTTPNEEELREYLRKKYNVSPLLVGSVALGLNVPEAKTDYDYVIPVQSEDKYRKLVKRLRNTASESSLNVPYADQSIFHLKYKDEPVDLALFLGEKGKKWREALSGAQAKLDDAKREEIVKRKQELKNSWFFPKTRYKLYKNKVDAELGLPRFDRDPIEQFPEELTGGDVYGHRTRHLDDVIKSKQILSAFDLARKGRLKDFESGSLGRGRTEELLPEKALRKEVFATKGLLPAGGSYGQYGVLFRKKDMTPSPYLNLIPEEHITDKIKNKMTFIVPDQEIEDWVDRHPGEKFIRESLVPENLRLNRVSITEPFKRLLTRDITLTKNKGLLDKSAEEIKTPLLPHQQRVVERLRNQPGLVVAHGLGTGKTLSSIAAAQDQGGHATALVPASLMPNYAKEILKHLGDGSNIEVRSQQRDALRDEQIPSDLLIVDEAHKARETSTKLHQLLADYPAAKRLLLTATPVYNRPSDIAPLVNIAAGESVLPVGSTFNEHYIYKPPKDPGFWYRFSGKPMKPVLKNKAELRDILQHWVDYQDNTGGDFPARTDESVRVPMSDLQAKLHEAAWGKLPRSLRKKLERGALPEGKELSEFNQFQSQARQVSGSTNKYVKSDSSPKTQRAVQELLTRVQTDPTAKAIVYSNYLNNLKEYDQQLSEKGIPHKLFTGNVKAKERQAAIDEYNTGKLKALLLSSAGGEGLDLKGTRLVQVLEPHWNEEKLDQVIGRAIRHGSHSDLPEDKRNVLVQRYITHPPAGLWDRLRGKTPIGVEDVLADMSKNKKDLNTQVLDLLRRDQTQNR